MVGLEQRATLRALCAQRRKKDSILLGALHQSGQCGRIAGRIKTGVGGTQHATVAGDIGSQHRDAGHHGLADDVGAAFHVRTHNQRPAAGQPAQRFPMAQTAQPAVAGFAGLPVSCFLRVAGVEGLADLQQADA